MEIKPIALGALKGAQGMLIKDLEALPEDAFDKSFGPKTRTVADIVYEVNLVNDHIGLSIRGEPLFEWPDGWIVAPDDAKTKEVVISSFKASMGKIVETVEQMTEQDLEGKITTEHGETTRFERCRFMASHIWYHSGQINYIQTMLGDDGWHWN